MLSPILIIGIIALYFILLITVASFTSKNADNEQFFNAKKQSHWVLVAIGMIGASLSGVTFISIPGVVGAEGTNQAFSYMQMVFGYLVGYAIIATVLLPIYYRLNLTTIYGYLEERFGTVSHKMGALFFILSRIIGASFRLFLVAIVLQRIVSDPLGIPFFLTVFVTIALIWVYTYKGGIKTIVWTDTLQTVSMIMAVVLTILFICQSLDASILDIPMLIKEEGLSQWFFFENGWSDPNNFFKQFISGALIALVMTGLDQDMMQKNLTCRSLKEAQKNVFLFSIVLVFANIIFLTLGALLYIYSHKMGLTIPEKTDQLFPMIAMEHLGLAAGLSFVVGLIAAAYSSADSALTSLTTSFCIDFLDFNKKETSEADKKQTRIKVHLGFSLILFLVIIGFNALNDTAVINGLFKAAGYTYGPILGLFAFGIFHKVNIKDKYVWIVCVLSPIICFFIDRYSESLLGGFTFGFLILALNGFLTYLGLWIIKQKA